MEQSVITEHDCNVLGGLFQIIVNDLKNGSSIWEDFVLKANKFQNQLKSTISASTAFLDAFQKVADMATTTRGGTKEIGTALTRLCLRHRSVEAKLKSFSSAILDCLIMPMQDRIDEWKKSTLQLDKEHNKEMKRLRQEFKKRQICDSVMTSSNYRSKKHSTRINKNSKYDFLESLSSKGIYGTIGGVNKSNSSLSRSLDSDMECNERLYLFEDLEKKAVRRALIEERSHFCMFVNFLRPVVEEEIAMIQEISHIQEIIESLSKLTADPFDLPPSSETVISNLKLSKQGTVAWNLQTPPSSPSSLGSRKSSMCSISSYNSSSSNSTYGPTNCNKQLSVAQISASNYDSSIYSHGNSATAVENIYVQKSDCSIAPFTYRGNESAHMSEANKSGFNDKNSKASESSELQFVLESDLSDHTNHRYQNAIPLKSTNPFLDCFTQDNIYKATPITTGKSTCGEPFSVAQDCNVYSEGSITPTNSEHRIATGDLFTTTANTNESKSMRSKSNKPPPAPPIRRTSSISNPNAITMGTLKNAAINSEYDGSCKNSSLYDEINVLTKSMNDINYSLKYTDFGGNPTSTAMTTTVSSSSSHSSPMTKYGEEEKQRHQKQSCDERNHKSEYQAVKNVFASGYNHASGGPKCGNEVVEDSSQLPLPAPPPEAFLELSHSSGPPISADSCSQQHQPYYNKITNVHRDFLETLNSKLSQSPLVHQSNTRISKRRSSNPSTNDDGEPSNSRHRTSSRSSSTTRTLSRKNSFEKSNIIGNFRENFIDKLNQSLVQKQRTNAELAKAAASNALQRKQSVPDLNELNASNLKHQNRVTFSSSLNLASPSQASFQVVQIQTNSTQQPIYSSRAQMRREIQELYGTIGTHNAVYRSHTDRDSSCPNGFFNKI